MVVRERRRKGAKLIACKITDKCTNCMACINALGCPALVFADEKVSINEALCTACGLCGSVCPYNAIECTEIG